jgi:RNA polymerase sigma-70 factor, ECF subfamily
VATDLHDKARAAWPGVEVPRDVFVTWLEARVPPGVSSSGVRAADLYLACACAQGIRAAITSFEANYFREIDIALRRMGAQDSTIDELKQALRQKLFVGDTGRGPAIAEYSGRGDLRRWLRATAVRAHLNLIRKGKKELLTEDERVFEAVSTPEDDPELQYMKARYSNEFREAFKEALESLSDREKSLLRHHFCDELNIDQIGAIYRVHRVTAFRWLQKGRETLVARTQRLLKQRLKTSDAEFESIVRLIRSQVDVSIRRLLLESKPDLR